jgi:MFS family permease
MIASSSATRTPLHLTYGLMLFGFGSISASRIVLSLYALNLGAPASTVGLLVACLYIFPVLISWHVGRHSDRVGSRWPLLFGAAIAACAMLIPFFFQNLTALFVAATLMGVAFTLYNVLLPNIVGLLSEPSERARNFSNASLVGAATLFSGPLLAGIAVDYAGHALACSYLVSLSVGAAILLLLWGHALPGGTRTGGASVSIRDTLRDPQIVRALASSSLVQVGQDLYQFYIPVYGYGINLSASAIGGLLALMAAASFVVRFALPNLITRLGDEKLLAYSFVITAAGFSLVPLFESVIALGVISFVFGLGMGCGQPITTMLIFSRSAEGRSGETLGLRQAVNNLLRVLGPSVFGAVASVLGLAAVFWISAAMMGSGAMVSKPRHPVRSP